MHACCETALGAEQRKLKSRGAGSGSYPLQVRV